MPSNEQALKSALKSGNILPCYFIFGDDSFLKHTYLSKISGAVANKNDLLNYCRYNENADLNEVYNAKLQFPFMADKKCVILCDYDFEKCDKSDFEKLIALLSEPVEHCVFIYLLDCIQIDFNKNAKAKKLAAAAEKSGGMAVQFMHKQGAELIKVLESGAKKRGCAFETGAAQYLTEISSADLETLGNELEKLCAYSGGSLITKETVEKVAVKTVEANMYDLSKKIFALKTDAAIKLLDDLFYLRVEPIIILSGISAAFVDAYRAFCAKKSGIQIQTAAGALGYKGREFVLKYAAENAAKLTDGKANLCFKELLKADAALKSFSADERTVFEQLTVTLINILAQEN